MSSGNRMPAQQGFYDKFVVNGDVVQLAKNLEGTEFTLAVPDYVWDAGVHDFADLNKFADKFDKKIYGITWRASQYLAAGDHQEE